MPAKLKRLLFSACGWICFALGVVGIFLPLMPTTIFWILAALCWSKSSPELMEKVYAHPRFGSSVKQFLEEGVVPRNGKVAAVSSMTISILFVFFLFDLSITVMIAIAAVISVVAIWIISRPEPIQASSYSKSSADNS